MPEMRQVEGVFRERSQAVLAMGAARRQGLEVPTPEDLAEDAAGVHVVVATGAPEDTRRLLLDYGAYTAAVV